MSGVTNIRDSPDPAYGIIRDIDRTMQLLRPLLAVVSRGLPLQPMMDPATVESLDDKMAVPLECATSACIEIHHKNHKRTKNTEERDPFVSFVIL
jgi:hypothetical protein